MPALPLWYRWLLDLRRRLDLAGDDLRAKERDLLENRSRHDRADLAQGDAVVLQVEGEVAATLELAALRTLDGEVDAVVDALDRARQDVRAEVRLVDVDADALDAGLLRRVERAEAARAGDCEDRPAAPWSIWFWPTVLHFAWSMKSCE